MSSQNISTQTVMYRRHEASRRHRQSHILQQLLWKMLLCQRKDCGCVSNMALSVTPSQWYISSMSLRTCEPAYLLINVITSVSSMVFRPACLEYVARSSLACSKYHSDACSTAASTSLLIFVLPFEPVRAYLAANFFTIPDGRLGTGIPCRDIFFSLRGRARRGSGRPDGVASFSDNLSLLSSMPKPPAASSDETEGGPGSIASSAKSSSFPIASAGPAASAWSGVGNEKSRLNRRRSSVSPLLVY